MHANSNSADHDPPAGQSNGDVTPDQEANILADTQTDEHGYLKHAAQVIDEPISLTVYTEHLNYTDMVPQLGNDVRLTGAQDLNSSEIKALRLAFTYVSSLTGAYSHILVRHGEAAFADFVAGAHLYYTGLESMTEIKLNAPELKVNWDAARL